MYHHHSQQQGPQPFSNGPRPPHHQPPPNQHQNRSPSNMLMGFQFPRPTQLPDELESALAIRGTRDIDHRLIDHMNQQQNQGSGSGISQHGSYGSNPIALTSDNQPAHQQGVDWSSYQPPSKLFASPPPSASHQSQPHQGPQQQPQSSHAGTTVPSWTAPVSDSPSPQARHPHSGGSGASGDGPALYTPESAGSILASFGLSNEDLEVLSHYPDDQLTPDTLPFILRDIQMKRSTNPKTVASASSSSFSHSPEVPSLLTVTQTAGKVIDYGHASRAKEESTTRETFKREPLSSERTVKMYPTSSASSSAPKLDKAEIRQVRLEPSDSSKHGDRDYRRAGSDPRKSNRSPGREFPPSSKSRNLDRDYRRDGPKPRPSSETKRETSSRRSLSSSSGSKPHSSSKKLPTPTMISDFSAVSPKVYPHTCSLCHTQCDQEKDWVDHINTVNHTSACRDLRNKYPDWKPNLPSRSERYSSRAPWDPKNHSPSHSVSRSLSGSPIPPPHSKHRGGPHPQRPYTGPFSLHHQPRHQHYTEHGHRLEHSPSGSYRPSSSREHRPEKRDREFSGGGGPRSGLKRPYDDSAKFSRHPFSVKAGHSVKHGPFQSSPRPAKSGAKPGTKTIKMSARLPPAKKKKRMATSASHDLSVAQRLVYLTGIPKDASEQEVTDLVGSFGKINNVILMACSEEDCQKGQGQKASVCMVKAEDAQALANSTNLSIRDQHITTLTAKKPDAGQSSDGSTSKPAPGQDSGAAGDGAEADHKTSDQKGMVLITGLPESGWSESDIINLVQPFGFPSDMILAAPIGKVLVSVPDMETAQEMVKVYAFKPAKMKDSELKMIHVKQRIGLCTPVALYNLLMGSGDTLEGSDPVPWSCLLVIRNVPNTPSCSLEVQKLVRRFGTVIKTLVLNNMVICEMATAPMALSVYKRFQTFPCIIQNNPLFFARKADPKASTPARVIAAYLDPPEDTPANGKGSQAQDEVETVQKENSQPPLEGIEKEDDGKHEKMESTEKMVNEDTALEENCSKDDEIQKEEPTIAPSDCLAAPEADLEKDMKEKPAIESVVEAAEDEKGVDSSTARNDETQAGEEAQPSSSDSKVASQKTAMLELPKLTQEMVNTLLVECRTRSASHPNKTPASTNGEQGETQMETEQGGKAAEEAKEPATNHTEEEEVKKQERERKEREARKEREVRERERKERERRAWEKEERSRRERERDERARRERERREEERRERERRERKRAYGESLSGSRWSYKQSSWRDEQYDSEPDTQMEEEEESDDFLFNMSDFVTVDEVGDVTELPTSPPPSFLMETAEGGEDAPTSVQQDSPSVPVETAEGGEDAPTSVQQDSPEDTPVDVTTETTDSPAALVKCDGHVSESEPETSDALVSSDLTLMAAASLSDSSPSQTHVSPWQPEAPETKITPKTEAALDSTEVEPLPGSSSCPATGGVTSDGDKEDKALNSCQAKKEDMVSDKTEGKTLDEEDKETGAPAAEAGKPVRSEEHTNSEDEHVKKKVKTDSTDSSLPPFDPSSPVGMEFLVPKTGFFCKVCNRFFSGNKEAEINHCKTLKHYENLQKHLQTSKTANVTVTAEST